MARSDLERSSSSGNSLDPKVMDSGSLPAASSPRAMDDTEVLSRRIPDPGEMHEAVRAAPEGETSSAGHMGEQIPMETGDGGHVQFGPSQIRSRRPIRLRNLASNLLRKKELCPFRR